MARSQNPHFKISRNHFAVTVIALAPILYFLPSLIKGRVLCPFDGLLQNVPFRVAAAQLIRSGYLPLWNPYIFSGMPLFATAQLGILYPLNWFYVPFSATTATNLMVIATYVVAGMGAYLYARQVGASVAGAAITSLAWQFGGAMIGQISHINIAQTAAVMPWVFWATERYAERGTFKRAALISVFIALQFFAGHQQAFVNSLLLVSAYLITMAATHAESRRRYLVSFAFVATGLLMAAIQILPTYELLRHSERSAATYEFFSSFSMPKRFVLTFVAPYVMGGGDARLFRAPYVGPPYYPEMVGYAGLLTIILAVIAVARRPDARTKFWTAVAVICLLLAFGGYAPLQSYKLIYYLPLLNLFRVPARHLMEVDFALAVLAGRGFTLLSVHREQLRTRIIAITAALTVLLFTVLAISLLRPEEFHLARELPVTILRAPELFVPLIIAGLSGYAVWCFARGKRGGTALIFSILVIDLAVWGQSSGWYVASPHTSDEYFHQPEIVNALNKITPGDQSSFRILTAPHQFNPSAPPVPPSVSHSTDFSLWTQPDVYMMHGIPNAAGYDGFGLERYSELAGRMKVWGELTDPDRTLRSDSREIDLANVRYLLAMRNGPGTEPSYGFANATQKFGEDLFGTSDLNLPSLAKNKRLAFMVPPVEIDRVGLITQLAWSETIPDQTPVARLILYHADGHTSEFHLRAGADTSEWSYDRPDIRARIRHSRATLAASYKVNDAVGSYDAHTFVTSLKLTEPAKITGGEITLEPGERWPDLTMTVFRLSLIDSQAQKSYALTREMVAIDQPDEVPKGLSLRWELLAQTTDVDVYQNSRAMPRAWLASQATALNESAMLEVIRNGRFADGKLWDPATMALVEAPLTGAQLSNGSGEVRISHYEPNRIELTTKSDAPALLVLSENHYPGWRSYVDNKFTETLRVDYNLRGIALPAGEHTVQVIYRPKSFLLGAAISLLTVALLAAGVVVDRRNRVNIR
jgi:hypothetical protein